MTQLTMSYVHGVSDIPLIGETVGGLLDRAAAAFGVDEALVSCHQGIRWSYAELNRGVDKVAAGLLALGLQPGERIGIWSPNNAEWLLTMFGAAKAGLILVSLNPAYRIGEIEYLPEQGRLPRADRGGSAEDLRLHCDDARAGARGCGVPVG